MKSEQIQTAIIVIAAMLLGSGITWYMLRQQQPVHAASPFAAPTPRPEATSKIKPTPLDPRVAEQADALDDGALESAIAAAKAARKAGKLKPLANSPTEFARVLGKWNFAIHEFVQRFPTAPDDSAPEYAAYRKELDQLTDDLANLLSDEELMTRLNVETPAQRATYQANLATGALGLDAAVTARLEAMLAGAYAEIERTAPDDAGLDKLIEVMNAKIIAELEALLTPDQRARLDSMGVARVLLGHMTGD